MSVAPRSPSLSVIDYLLGSSVIPMSVAPHFLDGFEVSISMLHYARVLHRSPLGQFRGLHLWLLRGLYLWHVRFLGSFMASTYGADYVLDKFEVSTGGADHLLNKFVVSTGAKLQMWQPYRYLNEIRHV